MTMQSRSLRWPAWVVRGALTVAVAACTQDALAPAAVQPGRVSAALGPFDPWGTAQLIQNLAPGAHPNFNTPYQDGCPVQSRDGLSFYMASRRPLTPGGAPTPDLNIWVAHRASVDEPWGEPELVPAPVSMPGTNEFCPMPARDGHEFFFVSNRVIPGVSCGGDDIYVTRFRDDGTIDAPENLGCDVNSPGNEAGPVPITEPGRGKVLYFSSVRSPGAFPDGASGPDADIYSAEWHGGRYQGAALVPGVNSPKDDIQPYIQRDALELYFSSSRDGNPDIYVATRAKAQTAWSAPVNLGGAINSGFPETRPSLSWDGTLLYFGSGRTGAGDIYVSTRRRPLE